jgi:hypothetical protein
LVIAKLLGAARLSLRSSRLRAVSNATLTGICATAKAVSFATSSDTPRICAFAREAAQNRCIAEIFAVQLRKAFRSA